MSSSFVTMKTQLPKAVFMEVVEKIAQQLSWKFIHQEDNKLKFKITEFLNIGNIKIEIYLIGDNLNLLAESLETDLNNRKIAAFFALYQKAELDFISK